MYAEKHPMQLLTDMKSAEQRESAAIDKSFEEVMNQIAIAKAFRCQIYRIHKYKSTACYFKSVMGYTKEEAKMVACPINQKCQIYDRFGVILSNLRDCPHVDIRKLSAKQLYDAFDEKWCISMNENLRGNTQVNNSAQCQALPYAEEDFSDFLTLIKQHPVYRSIDRSSQNNYGKREITALLLRTQKSLISGN